MDLHRDIVHVTALRTGTPRSGAAPGRNTGSARPRKKRPARGGLIVEWLIARKTIAGRYLRHLREVDRVLTGLLSERYLAAPLGTRLANALFAEFAADHGLCAGEMALLMDDPNGQAERGLMYLAQTVSRESRAGARPGRKGGAA